MKIMLLEKKVKKEEEEEDLEEEEEGELSRRKVAIKIRQIDFRGKFVFMIEI